MTMLAVDRPAASATPSINPAHAEVRRWLEDFAACVRTVDYDRGRAMFAEEVVGFGTFARMLVGRENLIAGQWKNIWGCTRGFRFIMDEAHVDATGEMAWVATPWHSEGRDEAGQWFDRHGRCTLILKKAAGKWLCVHSHYSRLPVTKKVDGVATPA
jgi:ketosteroid isomerase-like protein